MAENDWQWREIVYSANVLKSRYAADPNTYVASDLLVYYRQGDPAASVAPDVFVAFGAGNHYRRSYKLWAEPSLPSFVLEVLSHTSTERDLREKPVLYAQLGIQELWLFDPMGDHIEGQLLGLTLRGDAYEPIAPLPDRAGFSSAVLDLEIRNESGHLRMREPDTGKDLMSHRELYRMEAESRLALADSEARLAASEALHAKDKARIAAGEARSLDQARALLVRQFALRFGGDTAERFGVLLEGVSDPERLAEVGEWIIECPDGASLLARMAE